MRDIGGGDLRQRTKPLVFIGASIDEPVGGVAVRGFEFVIINRGDCRRLAGEAALVPASTARATGATQSVYEKSPVKKHNPKTHCENIAPPFVRKNSVGVIKNGFTLSILMRQARRRHAAWKDAVGCFCFQRKQRKLLSD